MLTRSTGNAKGHRRHAISLEETTKAVHSQNVQPGRVNPHASIPSHTSSFVAESGLSGLSGLFGSSGQPHKPKIWLSPVSHSFQSSAYAPIPSPLRFTFHVLRFTSPERQGDFSGRKRYSLRRTSASHIVSAGTRKGIHELDTRHNRITSISESPLVGAA